MRQRGSILILAFALSFLLSAVAISLLSLVTVRYRHFSLYIEEVQTRHECLGALQFASQLILKAPYQNGKNSFLSCNSSNPLLSFNDVTVSAKKISSDIYEITAKKQDSYPTYKIWIKERSIPKDFVAIVFDDTLNISDSKYAGSIFAIRDINIISNEEKVFSHPLLAGGKFLFSSLAAANTEFKGGYSDFFPSTPRPPQNYLELTRATIPSPSKTFEIRGAKIFVSQETIFITPSSTPRISLVLKGEQMEISTGNETEPPISLDIPDDGLVFVEGEIEIRGYLIKHLTVLTTKSIRITGDIIYLDENNKPPITSEGETNSLYKAGPSLCLVAGENIVYEPKPPSRSLTICALLVALNGSIYSGMALKSDLLIIYGARICRKRPFRLIRDTGFAHAIYLPDPKLATHAPKFAPLLTIPSIVAFKIEK